VDVYRGQYGPETRAGRFALFVAFFPHLVAGPIMRGSKLLPQFRTMPRWDTERAVSGLGLILWGLFEKVVIADRAAFFVDAVYAEPERYQGATLVVTTYLFAFQLYGDFCGYTDIAIGSARVLGFELSPNFDRPYASPSIIQFWRRWHMTFSTWFGDYVYTPLALWLGRLPVPWLATKTGRAVRTGTCVAVVFLLSGLWHGASLTYVAWGAFMGAVMIVSLVVKSLWKRSRAVVSAPLVPFARGAGVVLTFHLVCASLVLFRSTDFERLAAFATNLSVDRHVSVYWDLTHLGPAPPAAASIDLGVLLASIVVLEAVGWARAHGVAPRVPVPLRWLAWSALSVWIVLAAVQTHSPFIYFAF
jgi:alginate O-acetyltransferase complex protein AlgI